MSLQPRPTGCMSISLPLTQTVVRWSCIQDSVLCLLTTLLGTGQRVLLSMSNWVRPLPVCDAR